MRGFAHGPSIEQVHKASPHRSSKCACEVSAGGAADPGLRYLPQNLDDIDQNKLKPHSGSLGRLPTLGRGRGSEKGGPARKFDVAKRMKREFRSIAGPGPDTGRVVRHSNCSEQD